MTSLVETMASQIETNNLKEFKSYLESNPSNLKEYTNDIKYVYNLDLQIYSKDTTKITDMQEKHRLFPK
jgi:putative ABC transport system permease protein